MRQEELIEILTQDPADIVKDLSVTSFSTPSWTDLEKQYNPMQHSIITDTVTYPDKPNDKGGNDFKRTPLALQKLAVDRLSQSMFATPVQRVYTYDNNSEKAKKAVDLLEQLYRVHNSIDAENLERAKKLNASCQMVTVWRVSEKETVIEGEVSKYKLSHNTYSEMDGYKIYANVDNDGDLLVVSIAYTVNEVETFDVYTNDTVYRFEKGEDWEEVNKTPILFMPVIYAHIKEPVWGGASGTILVEQLEEMESFQGMYIKKNLVPLYTIDMGDVTGMSKKTTDEKSDDARRIIHTGKSGKVDVVEWEGGRQALNDRYGRIRNSYFEQIQVPDISFHTMINSNTSAENKELVFTDVKAKAKDLGGEWETLFYAELDIVKQFASVMYPQYAAEFAAISARSRLSPYNVRSKKEKAEYVSTAGDSMSLETRVRELDEVDDVAQEVETIQAEKAAGANQLY